MVNAVTAIAVIAIVTPLMLGLLLGVEALGGFLAGVILSGLLQAVFMANSGGAWDNAKKMIETNVTVNGVVHGKGSDAHAASVVGDTVGDPFKDTSGPSLNILIKLMTMVSVVMSGVTVAMSIL